MTGPCCVLVCSVPRTASLTTVLSQLIVKNAVELLAKSTRDRRDACAAAVDRVGPPVDPHELVTALENAVKDEINTMAVEPSDLTLVMSDRIVAGAAAAEQVSVCPSVSLSRYVYHSPKFLHSF